MANILCGAGRTIINPPVGDYLYGYSNDIQSTGIHDDLSVTALYLKSEDQEAVLLSFDLCEVEEEVINLIRQAVSNKVQVPLPQIFSTFIHTHTGPFLTPFDFLSAARKKAIMDYRKKLLGWAAQAADEAKGNAEECILKYNYTVAPENMNRRYQYPDRRFFFIPNQKHLAGLGDGYVDRELGMVAFKIKGKGNHYKAIITNFSAHVLCVGNSSTLFSADYQGVLRRTVEDSFRGALVLTTTGAVGDLHPLKPEAGFAYMEQMGTRLGIQVVERIYDSVEVEYDTKLRMAYNQITLKRKDEPTANLFPLKSERETALEKAQNNPREVKVSYYLLGLGPILFAGLPGEPVGALGAMLKWSSPFLKSYVLYESTGHDKTNYMVTSNQYMWGGYEANSSELAQGQAEYLIYTVAESARKLLAKKPIDYPLLPEYEA